MQIPGISAALQTSVANDANTQAAPKTTQQCAIAANANEGLYDSAVMGLAALLSAQGETVNDPNLQQFINPRDVSRGSATASGVVGPPATAPYVASEIVEGVGSNGVLTMAEVENAENGSAAPGATSLPSNSDAEITADFEKMSGGATTMTAAQLARAMQSYMDSQTQ